MGTKRGTSGPPGMTVPPRPERPPQPERPYMPDYVPDDAGPPGEALPWSRVRELFAGARNYWLCTTRPDGRPHAAPVWGLWLDGRFLLSTGRRSRKARNLGADPRCTVGVECEGVAISLEGTVEEVTDRTEMERFCRIYGEKYSWPLTPEFFVGSALYAVRPTVALSFAEELGDTVTRWRFS